MELESGCDVLVPASGSGTTVLNQSLLVKTDTQIGGEVIVAADLPCRVSS